MNNPDNNNIYLGKRGSSFLSVLPFEEFKKPNQTPVLLIESNKLISSISKNMNQESKNCTSPSINKKNGMNRFKKLNSKLGSEFQ